MKHTGTTRRHRWVAALTTTLMVITAAQSLADGAAVDGDDLAAGQNFSVTACTLVTRTGDLSIVRNSGSGTFAAGESLLVDVEISPVTSDVTSAVLGSVSSVPTGWASAPTTGSDPARTPKMADISTSVTPSAANGTYTVSYEVVGATSTTTKSASFTVTVDRDCPGTPSDTSAPTWDCTPAAADDVWHSDNQSHSCTASDATGVAGGNAFTLTTNVGAENETSNASTNSVNLCDTVTPTPNCTTAGPISGWMIDRKAPANIAFQGAPTTVVLGSPFPTVTCTADDGGSGLDECVVTGQDTSSIGPKTLTATATDNVGNESTSTHTYSVIFNWDGFLRPVDNLPILNTVKAGSSVPVKFKLGGDQGLSIMWSGYPKSIIAACDASAGTDAIEETATAGQSVLQYDSLMDTYTYVWKTEKSWAGQCRQLQVKLSDGTFHAANFKLTK